MDRYRKKARKLFNKWRKSFRLQDWEIDFRIVHFSELNRDKRDGWSRYGSCDWNTFTREATVTIVDMSTVPKDIGVSYSLDALIIHELLHIVISGHLVGDVDVNSERAVDVITRCLVGKPGSRR